MKTLLGLLSALVRVLPVVLSYLAGRRGQEIKTLEENADARKTADRVRRKLARNPDARKRLYDEFTR